MQLDASHDQLIHQTLAELFDQAQLRQFVSDWVGGSISRQLPGEVASLEALAHGAVVVLRRNGLLDTNFFSELLRVRPTQQAFLLDVAERCGVGRLDVRAESTALALPSVRTPDFVVQQTYESLRLQRDSVREFVNHFSLPKIIMIAGGTGSSDDFMAFILGWLDTRAGEIMYQPARQALQCIGLAIAGLSAKDEGMRVMTAFVTFLMGAQIEGIRPINRVWPRRCVSATSRPDAHRARSGGGRWRPAAAESRPA